LQEARTGLFRTGACEAFSVQDRFFNRYAIGPISVVATTTARRFAF
jgi:hypothetical protein